MHWQLEGSALQVSFHNEGVFEIDVQRSVRICEDLVRMLRIMLTDKTAWNVFSSCDIKA